MFFSRHARKVWMVVRGPTLSAGMSQYLVDRIGETPNVEVVTGTEVAGVRGDGTLEQVDLRDSSGAVRTIDAAAMFIFIGTAPRTELVAGVVARDEKGFILTGRDLTPDGARPAGWSVDRAPFPFETSVPGVFAAGDVRAGSGKRVAAAVGEGSATVGMVHAYLRTV
jgi:thioredoxin reductase (NADPH)